MSLIRHATCAFALFCMLPVCAAAQTPADSARADTIPKTPAEQIRERLRRMRPIGGPDTVPNQDSVRAAPQQLRINGNPTGAPGVGNPAQGNSAPANIQRDSIWERLLKLPGFNATEYKGDTANFRADSSNLQLNGNALVSRDGQVVEAGRITYADSISLVCGFGKPKVSGAGTATPLESDSICYDINARYGVAHGATTSISEGAVWRMYSPTIVTRGDNYYSKGAIFTDCDLPWDEVHYAFEARQVLAKRNNLLVARDVTLKFKDVPVFWLPFMVQSLSQGRRSGILTPRFGVNDIARTSSRYSRRIEDVGFYWAISDYMGSEVAFDWMSNNWTALRGSFDYNFLRQFVRGGLTVRRFWKDEGGTELTLASQNSWEPNERTRIQANANFSTSSAFVSTRSYDPRELNRSIDSNFTLNRRFNFGSLTLGSSRRQYLTDNTLNQVLPNASFSLSPVTLFSAQPGEEHWYSNATWTASADTRREVNTVDDANPNPSAQTRHQTTGRIGNTFNVGKLQLAQNFSVDESRSDARPVTVADSIINVPQASTRRNAWDLGVNYQQHIIGTTNFTPGLRLNGESISNDKTQNKLISAPVRLDFTASLNADAYGIFNVGIGPFERFRHKFSPSFSYNYSPKPTADSLQNLVFSGIGNTLERNTISIGLNQTFEAKYREQRDSTQIAADSMAADTATGPRHMQATRTVMLLGISTGAVAYDFVQARKFGDGFATATLTNDFRSDLIPGFTFSIAHDLFETVERTDGQPTTVADRKFKPHLSSATAHLGISGSSWLFRVLHLGRRDSMPVGPGDIANDRIPAQEGGVAADRTQSEFGLVGTRNRYATAPRTGNTGAWTATLDYTLSRPRTNGAVSQNQFSQFGQSFSTGSTLRGTLSFQPTDNWTANWNTSYSITLHQFSDQFLTLTRKMHDWDANFDFIKAQNGNFSFQFRVNLRANPDIKLDWSQNEGNAAFPQSRIR